MKRILLFLMMALAVIVPASADKNKGDKAEMRKELKEYKMKFLAQEMNLKEEQQKKFFELYGKMWDEKEKLHHDVKEMEKKLKKDDKLTDAEYGKVSKAINEAKEKEAALEGKYDAMFSKFLTSEQMVKMKSAEEKFKARMRELRDSKKGKKRAN